VWCHSIFGSWSSRGRRALTALLRPCELVGGELIGESGFVAIVGGAGSLEVDNRALLVDLGDEVQDTDDGRSRLVTSSVNGVSTASTSAILESSSATNFVRIPSPAALSFSQESLLP